MLRIPFCLALASALFFAVAPQEAFSKELGLKIVYDSMMNMYGQPLKSRSTYFGQDGNVRFEMQIDGMKGLPPSKVTTLVQAKGQKQITLFEDRKSYMELSKPPEKREEKKKIQGAFISTGKIKKIAGYSCEVYRRTSDMIEEACVCKELTTTLRELEKSRSKFGMSMTDFPQGLSGFPMEYIVRSKDGQGPSATRMEIRVEEFKRENIAATQFQIPKGYQKLDPRGRPQGER